MADWDLNLDNAPIDEPFLVLLERPHTNSRIQVAVKHKTSSTYVAMTVASCFASDVGPILGWRRLELPDDCELCGGVKGGVRGNENVVAGRTVCDYCHAQCKEIAGG